MPLLSTPLGVVGPSFLGPCDKTNPNNKNIEKFATETLKLTKIENND